MGWVGVRTALPDTTWFRDSDTMSDPRRPTSVTGNDIEFGAKAIASIAPAHCEQLLTALVRKQSRQGDRKAITPGTVKHVWDVARRVLRYAVQHRALDANPTDRVDFSASHATGDHARVEHRPLTAAEVGALSAAVAGNPLDDYDGPALPAYPAYALLAEFMAYSGYALAKWPA